MLQRWKARPTSHARGRRTQPAALDSAGRPRASIGACRSRTNADDRLPLASLGPVEGGDGVVEGRDVAADDIEHQIDSADVFEDVVLEVDELLRAEVERLLTVGSASGADDVGAELTCELRDHRPDCAG